MLENGSDITKVATGALRGCFVPRRRLLELLVEHGSGNEHSGRGKSNICAPCETLAPRALQWLINHGADMHAVSADYGSCVQMLIGTYARNSEGKHACLEVFASSGYPFPNTAPMAVHRARIDLLGALIDRGPALLERRFPEAEIFPELGGSGLHVAPLDGEPSARRRTGAAFDG